jgi:fibronectin type 3 domain-containing protein
MMEQQFNPQSRFLGASLQPAGTAVKPAPDPAPPVPLANQDLYGSMQASIDSFNQSTLAAWDGSRSPVIFSADAQCLNSNNGSNMITPSGYQAALMEVRGLKALGLTGVELSVAYPTLDPSFDAWGGQSANFLATYKQAVNDIRALGLAVTIETAATFSAPVFGPVNVNLAAFYNSLSSAEYRNGRAQQALLIAQQLQPDYLNVVEEPDTEAAQTGKPECYTYSGSMQLLNTILGVLRSANVTPKIGAGVGTWLSTDAEGKTYVDYINGYASTSVDSIDMHVYPVYLDYLPRMNTIAGIAQASGKRITITEAWSYKQRATEGSLGPTVVYSRDVYSFWAPLDIQFFTAIVNWSFYQKADMMNAFWSGYFRSYLDYDSSSATMTPGQLNAAVQPLQATQISVGGFSSSGAGLHDLLVSPADTTAPEAPIVVPTAYPCQVVLNWAWPSDNVGVSQVDVARSGMTTVTTTGTAFSESGLADGQTYTYTVTALDFANNQTSATVTVTLPDTIPPSAPTSISATLLSYNSILVSWSAATDNVQVVGYKLYRGVNGQSPVGRASLGAVCSFTDTNLQSNTSYCYYVLSQDESGQVSAPSPTACATTPDTRPPSVPTSVTAAGSAAPLVTISWAESTDSAGVAGYKIQRSLYPGNAAPLATGVTATSYVDSTATTQPDSGAPVASVYAPAANSTNRGIITFSASARDTGTPTTYLYQVAAYDAAGNVSNWSASGMVTWPAAPSGIAGVRFLVDNVDVAPEVTATPYYVRWDTRTVANGEHTLRVVARDNAGNSTVSAPVTIQVQN